MNPLTKPLCAALLAMSLAAPAWADISREAAAAAAQQVVAGRVLSVDKVEAGRRPAWRVKMVTAQGEVRVVLIDAASGKAL